MTALQTFDFGGRKVRTAGTHEAPLFCGTDVCSVLGLAISGKDAALARLDQEERVLVKTSVREKSAKTPNLNVGPTSMVYVTESGLYALILSCEKPEAKAFKRWITAEVLPAIRKHGYYSVLEAEQAKQTERLLAEIFPALPKKSEPIFRELIAALLRVRREQGNAANPPWARTLANLIYGWAIQVEGQQEFRRTKNPKPAGNRTDHSMFSEPAHEHVCEVVRVGCAFALTTFSWGEWKEKMQVVFGGKQMQAPLWLVLPKKEAG